MNWIESGILAFLMSFISTSQPGQANNRNALPYTPSAYIFASNEQIQKYENLNYLQEVKSMLNKESPAMSQGLINTVLMVINCIPKYKTHFKPILTVIDFSLPASRKRLWIFDLNRKKMLLNTHVSHGIKSGISSSHFFSNRHNSKASSIGVYKTENDYYGRYGLALKLVGLERGFNDNAFNRAVVMHGGWYVDEKFVDKYGRPGRSWGCPAVPKEHTKFIINTIKDNSLLIAYYPSQKWYTQSDYLNCKQFSVIPADGYLEAKLKKPEENRAKILFIEKNNNNLREENEPIAVISADDYRSVFKRKIPLKRMIRRPLKNEEIIALSPNEMNDILSFHPEIILTNQKDRDKKVFFILPYIKKVRGYYATEMRIVSPGNIKEIQKNKSVDTSENPISYTLHLEDKSKALLKATGQFIRWLGL